MSRWTAVAVCCLVLCSACVTCGKYADVVHNVQMAVFAIHESPGYRVPQTCTNCIIPGDIVVRHGMLVFMTGANGRMAYLKTAGAVYSEHDTLTPSVTPAAFAAHLPIHPAAPSLRPARPRPHAVPLSVIAANDALLCPGDVRVVESYQGLYGCGYAAAVYATLRMCVRTVDHPECRYDMLARNFYAWIEHRGSLARACELVVDTDVLQFPGEPAPQPADYGHSIDEAVRPHTAVLCLHAGDVWYARNGTEMRGLRDLLARTDVLDTCVWLTTLRHAAIVAPRDALTPPEQPFLLRTRHD